MYFASDNTGPAHPSVIEALAKANGGYVPGYGGDDLTIALQARVREVFEAPQAAVYLVTTGTAANALALATLCQPFQTIYCARHAHVAEDECGAPEFFTGGAKLTLVDGPDARIGANALAAAMDWNASQGVHGVAPGPVTLTQASERGTVYRPGDLAELSAVAGSHDQPLHMDGARFANALLHLGCTPAELTWKSGVEALSFGGTKNGLLGVEAVVLFDPARAREFEHRRKRAGQLLSKHRYLAAQMLAWLDGDLWLTLAGQANASAARLAQGLADVPGVELLFPREANLLFVSMPRRLYRHLRDAGAQMSLWEGTPEGDPDAPLMVRLVCDWSLPQSEIDRFLKLAAQS